MTLAQDIHGSYVFPRRVRVLSDHLLARIPPGSRVLDVGCGEGRITDAIARQRPDVEIRGIDVLERGGTAVKVELFDGKVIPHGDKSFDVVMLIDVLHHTAEPPRLLKEAVRTARGSVLVKDHLADRFLAVPTLQFMDRLGNARHGVSLPFNYWTLQRWREVFDTLELDVEEWKEDLGLYPPLASWIFERGLHFLARLRPARETGA